jgi:hypothetical protein
MGIDDESSHPELCSAVADGVTRNIVSLFREPDAGDPPVRFDEREQETELRQTGLRRALRKQPNSHREAKATAPVLDSTQNPPHGGGSTLRSDAGHSSQQSCEIASSVIVCACPSTVRLDRPEQKRDCRITFRFTVTPLGFRCIVSARCE